MITMAIRILYQNEAEKSKSGDNDFFLLTNQICLYVGAALENEIYTNEIEVNVLFSRVHKVT